MANIPPTAEVLDMQKRGMTKEQIISALTPKGFSPQQINEAVNQASIKRGVESQMPEEESDVPTTEMQVSALSKEDEIPVPTPTVEEAPAVSEVKVPSAIPSPQVLPQSQQSFGSYEEMQSLVEEIIDEKWKDFVSTVGDISNWKAQMGDENEAIKQEILRMQSRVDTLQAAVLGKVDEYGKGVKNISTQMQALEKVFEKILEPLTSNIKELNHIVDTLRKKK